MFESVKDLIALEVDAKRKFLDEHYIFAPDDAKQELIELYSNKFLDALKLINENMEGWDELLSSKWDNLSVVPREKEYMERFKNRIDEFLDEIISLDDIDKVYNVFFEWMKDNRTLNNEEYQASYNDLISKIKRDFGREK